MILNSNKASRQNARKIRITICRLAGDKDVVGAGTAVLVRWVELTLWDEVNTRIRSSAERLPNRKTDERWTESSVVVYQQLFDRHFSSFENNNNSTSRKHGGKRCGFSSLSQP